MKRNHLYIIITLLTLSFSFVAMSQKLTFLENENTETTSKNFLDFLENLRKTIQDKWILSRELKDKLDKLSLENLRDITLGLEREFTKDEQKAKENIEKIEKYRIIEYINSKFGTNGELRELISHLKEKSPMELRKIVQDLEIKFEKSADKAKENLENIEKKFIFYFIYLKFLENRETTEEYLEKKISDIERNNKDKEEHHEDHDHHPIYIGGGLHDYLANKDQEMLIEICLGINLYHRNQTGSEEIGGNTHAYLHRLSEHDLREYILTECDEHPEINSVEKLEELVKAYKNLKPTGAADIVEPKPGEPKPDEPKPEIHKFLLSLSREDLLRLAYSAEKFHKKATHTERHMGGYHDYIWRISDDEIRKIITKEVGEHPELENVDKLKSMITEDIILLNIEILSNIDKNQDKKIIKIDKNIKQIIRHGSRQDLIKIVNKLLSTINHNEDLKNLDLEHMSNDHIRKFIKNLIRRHDQELNKEELFKI